MDNQQYDQSSQQPHAASQPQPGGSATSSFPDPPMDYIRLYSDENIAAGLALPPPPPIQGGYCMFNNYYNTEDPILQSLEIQGVTRLYPGGSNVDHKAELKKLNHSVLAAFLDLLEILITNPDSPERIEKLDNIELLFFNMHHLINEFRPHQARETLRLMLDVQLRERQDTAERFQKFYDVVANRLRTCLNDIPAHRPLPPGVDAKFCDVLAGRPLTEPASGAGESHSALGLQEPSSSADKSGKASDASGQGPSKDNKMEPAIKMEIDGDAPSSSSGVVAKLLGGKEDRKRRRKRRKREKWIREDDPRVDPRDVPLCRIVDEFVNKIISNKQI